MSARVDPEPEIRSRLKSTPSVPIIRSNLDAVLRRARAGRLRRSIGWVLAAALVLGGLGVPLALLFPLGGSAPERIAGPSTGMKAVPADTVKLQGAVDVAEGEDAIWVSGFGVVSRVDPTTDRVVATVETKGVEDFSRVADGLGAVWVTADGGVLYRIDPATNQVAATIQIGGVVGGVDTGGGYVWVARSDGSPGTVVRVDPATDRIAGGPIEVGPGPIEVLYAYGALWVANTSPASVVRVDPVTEQVTTEAWSSDLPGRLAAGHGSIWEASGGDSVIRADPATGRTLATIPVPRASSVAIGDGRVWVLGSPESSRPNLFYPVKGTAALWQIDPSTNRVVGGSVHLDALGPIALAAGDGSVWVADYEGQAISRFDVVPCEGSSCHGATSMTEVDLPDGLSASRLATGVGAVWALASKGQTSPDVLVRIDPATNQVLATIPLQGEPWHVAAADGAVWVGSPRSSTLQRIDAATNEMTGQIQLPGDDVTAMAADDQAVWVEVIQDRSDQGQPNLASLVQVDPSTNKVVATIPLEGLTGYDDEIAIGAGSVWVVGVSYSGNAERGSDLIQIDPATNEIEDSIPGPAFSVRAGADAVWVTAPADGVNDSLHAPESWVAREVDPTTQEVSAPISLPGNVSGVLAVTADWVWFSGYDDQGLIHPVRLQDGAFDTSVPPVNSEYTDMAFDDATNSIWVAAVSGLERIDLP